MLGHIPEKINAINVLCFNNVIVLGVGERTVPVLIARRHLMHLDFQIELFMFFLDNPEVCYSRNYLVKHTVKSWVMQSRSGAAIVRRKM